jgi:hypothetical protein
MTSYAIVYEFRNARPGMMLFDLFYQVNRILVKKLYLFFLFTENIYTSEEFEEFILDLLKTIEQVETVR